MLPQTQRISRARFPVFTAKHIKKDLVFGIVRYYPGGTEVSVSVIVAKKTAKKSVDRHRIKRRIYSVFEKNIQNLPPGQYICTAYMSAYTMSFDEMVQSLRSCL